MWTINPKFQPAGPTADGSTLGGLPCKMQGELSDSPPAQGPVGEIGKRILWITCGFALPRHLRQHILQGLRGRFQGLLFLRPELDLQVLLRAAFADDGGNTEADVGQAVGAGLEG